MDNRPHPHHFVRFSDDEASLTAEVGAYLLQARDGGTAIIISTPERLRSVKASLDGAADFPQGRLLALDAATTLQRFMVDDRPDPALFDAVVGDVVRAACRRPGPVFAYGEMVSLLCGQGLYDAAIELEKLWNDLARTVEFSLFCAYAWDLFPTVELEQAFGKVCREHAHACSDRQPEKIDTASPAINLLELERKALALDAEVARRKLAEQAAAAGASDMADFLDNAAEGIHRVGRDGTILWANKAELEMLGYSAAEYVGQHIGRFHVDAPVIERILDHLLRGLTLHDEPARLRCKNGGIKHVVISSNGRFEQGHLRYTRCFTRDASERYERDLALRQRDQMLLRAPVAAALLAGAEFRHRLVNRRYLALMGGADLQDRTYAEAFPALVGGALHQLLRQVHASGRAFSTEEICLADGDPERDERYFQLSLEPLPDAQGDVDSIIVVLVDITEHVRSRRVLKRAHDEREKLVGELTATNRNKDEFLAMLGHELRNPLAPIVMALDLMARRGDATTATERGLIGRQVQHLVRLVDDLLDVARVTQDKIALQREHVAMDGIIGKAVELASAEIGARRHRLAIDAEPDLALSADPVRLSQALANLLTNAAKYTPDGGDIRLSARRGGDGRIRVAVADSGRGMGATEQRQVFDLFYQGQRGIDRADGGLGIGLSLVKRLVQLHGGSVDAYSAGPGLGSEFAMHLPASSGAPPTAPAPDATAAAAATATARPLRILVVDDNVDAVETMGELLALHGHSVQTCHTPEQALARIRDFSPDVAILDIGLPGMSGHVLAGRIKTLMGANACRLIAQTGYGQPSDIAASAAAGFEVHLVKPVDPARLLALIEQSGPRAR
jgi:PAS domain S-box-containing protein